MAKDKITEYDATANNNTVCGDVNIAENSALPSDMNNFAREIMSHLKEGLGSGTPLYVDQTNNRVGINKTPTVALDVSGDADLSGTLDVTGTITVGDGHTIGDDGSDNLEIATSVGENLILASSGNVNTFLDTNEDQSTASFQIHSGTTSSTHKLLRVEETGDISFYEDTGTTPKLFWQASTERLGIGTSSPASLLEIKATSLNRDNGIALRGSGANDVLYMYPSGDNVATIEHLINGTTNTGGVLAINPQGGNVGIGTSSPDADLSLISPVYTSGGADNGIRFQNQNNNGDAIVQSYYSGTNPSALLHGANIYLSTGASFTPFDNTKANSYILQNTNGNIEFGNANSGTASERMRVTSAGDLLVSTTSTSPHVDGSGIAIRSTDGVLIGVNSTHAIIAARHGSDGEVIRIQNGTSDVGSIDVSGSSTSYNTSSDHRLKENVSYDFDATTRLKQLRPARFNFIADADTTVDGFLAHEVQSVVPEAITGTHNEVDADGNPVYQGIDQSKLVPLLVKTIQELEARIVALETA